MSTGCWPCSGRMPSTAPTRSSQPIGRARHPGLLDDVAAAQANVEFDAERLWVVGRTVLANWHGAFTDAQHGERVRERGFMTMELDEAGLVTRCREWAVSRDGGHRFVVHRGTRDRSRRTRWQVTRHSTW